MSRMIVMGALACAALISPLLATSSATAVTTKAALLQPAEAGLVQPDLPGLVTELLSQSLAMKGLEVYRDGYFLSIRTPQGDLVDLQMPQTLDALTRGDFTGYVNGALAYSGGLLWTPKVSASRPGSNQQTPAPQGTGGGLGLLDCLNIALDIFGLQTEICLNLDDGDLNVYCLIEASADLVTNTLKCTF
jgi:hypothetical protein